MERRGSSGPLVALADAATVLKLRMVDNVAGDVSLLPFMFVAGYSADYPYL